MPTDNEYGSDRYIYKDGQRLRTRMVRTIQPIVGETNAEFERRMERLAEIVAGYEGTVSVELEFERRAGSIVQCTIDVQHAPRVEFILDDARPAGGRSNGRGQRAA